ncbi:flagellar assembly peptidoglycan hydrolase FlgJ [Marinobacter panjinensis]|uniref:Peptidoglycan hydrolase FlgJ n=1 Tax=Marinobacter panjinensis TaxID=2576384 RepID=A0A4U6R091_9GAMM|nr:flagellar assembly peptidoglycan hydrolase FlgJ [Marinobacter panjinensis]MCR8915552.1 flagellar assembly peptidoglycan hydrolase FlgJ [Marinobacter panjinensis]TKV66803.1 flagellar assembly peptidoglycan hydrolase FlgJ [Marinobacter panjinensis]
MQDFSLQKAQVYTDFGGLNDLKTQARTDKNAALMEVAKQFEGLFLSEMVKSMRKAGDVFAEGNYLNSQQSEFYREMFDSQLSLTLSQKQGTGLSEALVRQLSRQIPGMDEQGEPMAAHKKALADYDRSLPVLSPRLPEQVEKVNQVAEAAAPVAEPKTSAAMPDRFDSPAQFVRELLPVAEKVAEQSGINPRLMIAQAALETGWGRHMIEGDGGAPSFNLFGIKADTRWQGDSVNIATTEFREGVPMNERAAFRSYPDYESSFRDYVSFLESNPRYRDVLAAADNPDEFADRLQQAGYATDPNYGAKIRRIMNNDTMTTLSMGSRGAEE